MPSESIGHLPGADAGERGSTDRRRPRLTGAARLGAVVLVLAAATLAAVALAGTASAHAASAANDSDAKHTVTAEIAEESIDAGNTAELNLTLSQVPDLGMYGMTVNLEAEAGTATFQEGITSETGWSRSEVDLAADEGEHTATVTVGGSATDVDPGAEDVHVGTVELTGHESTEIDVEVQSLVRADDTEVENVSGDTATLVVGSTARNVSVGVDDPTLGPEETANVTLELSDVQADLLASANATVSVDGDAAYFTGGAFPDWNSSDFSFRGDETQPSTATVSVSELQDTADDSSVEIGTLELRTTAPGALDLTVESTELRYGDVEVPSDGSEDSVSVGDRVPLAVDLADDAIDQDGSTQLNVSLAGEPDAVPESVTVALDASDSAVVSAFGDATTPHENASVALNDAGDGSAQLTWNGTNATLPADGTNVTIATVAIADVGQGTATIDASAESVAATSGSAFGTIASGAALELTVESSDDGGGGGLPALPSPGGSSGGDGDDGDGEEGEQGRDDPDEAPEFALGVDSTVGPVVLEGQHARADESAAVDPGTDVGALELERVAADAGSSAESFEVAVEAGARAGPDVDGEVVETIAIDHEGVLERTTLTFSVRDAARPDGVAESDLAFYARSDGEWRETSVDRSDGSVEAALEGSSALAVVAPADDEESADGDGDDGSSGDSLGIAGLNVVLALGALLTVFLARARQQ